MRFYSTNGKCPEATLKEAILQGFAPDGGLYVPSDLPIFSPHEIHRMRGLSLTELSIEMGKKLFEGELTTRAVTDLFEKAFNFPAPFFSFSPHVFLMELFHGPTLSFKDFGARFLANLMQTFRKKQEQITVLVATSGDTGSAVGNAFLGMAGFRVLILYPKGYVTPTQEMQLTTIGGNVTAFEVDGSFEACQTLLKTACLDPSLSHVTTANSINIGRILSQAIYYFFAFTQLPEEIQECFFSIPSGNFGHLVSGVIAKKMGLPINRFLAATNINDEVPIFLKSGEYHPHEAYHTIAVSMDVGNPSNFSRLCSLYGNSLEKMRADLWGISFTDEAIKEEVNETLQEFGYLLDPHSAVASLALKKYRLENKEASGIFFATAHPAKFREALSFTKRKIDIPKSLQQSFDLPKKINPLSNSYDEFKKILSTA